MHPISEKILNLLNSTPGATRAKLADYVGVSRATVTKWFNDPKEPEPDYKNVVKVCEYFHIPTEYFYDNGNPNYDGEYDNYKLVKEVGNPDDLGYFLDPETLSYAEELRHNPELKAVFDVARDMPKEKLEAIYNVLKQME